MIMVDKEKMSKSLCNFFTIRDVLSHYDAESVRYFLLSAHYRSQLNYSEENLNLAHGALERLYTALRGTDKSAVAFGGENFVDTFRDAMDDDFNTAQAVAVLFELAKEVNQTKSPELARQLKKLGGVFGILQLDPEAFVKGAVDSVDEAAVEALIAERKAAKAAKNWARADEIRKELLEKNIVLEDAPGGVTTWRRA